ncbi:MAG: hypothetical protein HDR27_07060 [Lachnospiraceae bacterium]|nr:hypothetical protein [Lachnospiraceae bacterium]
MESINREKNMESRLNHNGWKEIILGITLSQQMKESIMEQVKDLRAEKNRRPGSRAVYRIRYAKMIPAICMLFVLATVSMTAHAVYVNKHLNVFFEKDITAEQMRDIERALEQMEGVVSCRYIDRDTAWKMFSEEYLTPELLEGFTGNPLEESANFKVGVSLDTDAEQMKARIGELDGVRRVTGLWEE